MDLTPAQSRVIDGIRDWLEGPLGDQEYVLAGYAGTGKTTLIRKLLELRDGQITCCAPTGKAAQVLRSKLPAGANVSTIHSLIYTPREVDDDMLARAHRFMDYAVNAAKSDPEMAEQARIATHRLRRLEKLKATGMCDFSYAGLAGAEPRDLFEEGPDMRRDVIVIDEASMVSEQVERDLRRTGAKLVFVGDPGQLPPVEGRGFFDRNRPDAMLEKIHRQAAESPILRFATAARLGGQFSDWTDACQFYPRGAMDIPTLCTFDKVITGKNGTRRALNVRMRHYRGYTGLWPRKGEELICLRNNRDLELINGMAAWMSEDAVDLSYGMLECKMMYEGQERELIVDDHAFRLYDDPNAEPFGDRYAPQFDFGHCITVHKSQGSEWKSIAVVDDGMFGGRAEDRRRWAYTAITRAGEKLAWVQGG